MSKTGKPRNKRIGQGSCVRVIHNESEKSEPYEYDPKNNVSTRAICKTCAYRIPYDINHALCACMAMSNMPRDKHATNRHCATYKKGTKAGKKVLL